MAQKFKRGIKLTDITNNWELYLFLLPAVAFYVIFHYGPMGGIQLAFKRYSPVLGIWGSPFVGFRHFESFFNHFQFFQIIGNTLILSFYHLVLNTTIPFVIALIINQIPSKRFKKTIQTVTYAPHFISTIVLVGMMYVFMSPSTGIVNHAIRFFGGTPYFFFGEEGAFRHMYVWSGIWQNTGWRAIIYLAALSAINPELHEAATVDGATKFQRILHVDVPGILPTAIIILILNVGRVMNIGFQKAFLMQTALNVSTAEIIPTFVYKAGLLQHRFEFGTAVGLFNSIINILLIFTINRLARRVSETSLW